jgi:hypothetical protein
MAKLRISRVFPDHITEINSKRQSIQAKAGQQQDFESMLQELQKMQMAALMGQTKPSVVLTDQTDLGDRISEFGQRIEQAVKGLDSSDHESSELEVLQAMKSVLEKLNSSNSTDADTNRELLSKVVAAINALKLNVEAPQITVEPTPVDFTPLQDTIKEYFASDQTEEDSGICFEDYKAQDISETDNMQYVGFVNPKGNWYIIENDVKGNSLRYLFGTKNYAKTFKKASTYQYFLLNEAINALSA